MHSGNSEGEEVEMKVPTSGSMPNTHRKSSSIHVTYARYAPDIQDDDDHHDDNDDYDDKDDGNLSTKHMKR
eukprot:212702-Amorphochlora_amoeboformis.AAC.1